MRIHNRYAEYPIKPLIEVIDNAFKTMLLNINYEGVSVIPVQPKKPTSANNREETVLRMFDTQKFVVRKDIHRPRRFCFSVR